MAGMEPGPEHFAQVEYKVLNGMQSEMSVSGLLGYLQVCNLVLPPACNYAADMMAVLV